MNYLKWLLRHVVYKDKRSKRDLSRSVDCHFRRTCFEHNLYKYLWVYKIITIKIKKNCNILPIHFVIIIIYRKPQYSNEDIPLILLVEISVFFFEDMYEIYGLFFFSFFFFFRKQSHYTTYPTICGVRFALTASPVTRFSISIPIRSFWHRNIFFIYLSPPSVDQVKHSDNEHKKRGHVALRILAMRLKHLSSA